MKPYGLNSAQDGAFIEELYRVYAPLMFSAAYEFDVTRTQAEDIVSQSLLKLMQNVSTLRRLKGGALKKGSKGASVYWLQRRLKELGYYDTKCTGRMLDRTVQAIKAFQKDHGYMQSGSVDQRLIDALAEAEKMTPEPGPVPTPAP